MNVRHNEAEQRYEVERDGETAVLTYRVSGNTITFTHTIVPPEMEGGGVGSALVKTGLAAAREQGMKVVPSCSFVRGYIERHSEYQELLA